MLSDRYRKIIGKKVFVVVEFSLSYCLYCLKLSEIINKISAELKETPAYKIFFTRVNL